ncbi:MAG: LapA family protein [Candidatus Rokuibacteriota bacterium]
MQLALLLLLVLSLAVALFALQNADAVTVRFWPWEFQASVAILTLGALTVGALMAGLVSLAARLGRWTRRHGPPPVSPPPQPADTPPLGPGAP